MLWFPHVNPVCSHFSAGAKLSRLSREVASMTGCLILTSPLSPTRDRSSMSISSRAVILADFLIGAHALEGGHSLLKLDGHLYHTAFPVSPW